MNEAGLTTKPTGNAPRGHAQTRYVQVVIMGLALFAFAAFAQVAIADQEAHPPPSLAAAERARSRGDLKAAAASYEIAATESRQMQQVEFELRALLGLADALQMSGSPTGSQLPLERALYLAQESRKPALLATSMAALGRLQIALGTDEAALESLSRARQSAVESNLPTLLCAIENDLGTLRATRHERAEARTHFLASAAHARTVGSTDLEARALANVARLEAEQGDPMTALGHVERATSLTQASIATRDQLYLLIDLARVHQRLATSLTSVNPPLAERAAGLLNAAARMATELEDPKGASYAWGYLALLREEQGDLDGAMLHNQRALAETSKLSAPELSYRWLWQRARLLAIRGDRGDAIDTYRRTIELAKKMRAWGTHGYQRGGSSFSQDRAPVYLELVELLLGESGSSPDPERRESLLREARSVVEQSKAAELDDYFQDECVEEFQATRRSLDEIGARAVVIYPIIFTDRLELLLTLPGGRLRRHTANIGAEALGREVAKFRELLTTRTTREYLRPARVLYDALIRPLEGTLEQVGADTLVIVPDGPLRTIPLAALHDGERFLIEEYALAMTPGIQLTDPAPLPSGKLRALFAGISESIGGFSPLEHVPEELAEGQERFGGELMLDEDFRLADFGNSLEGKPLGLVHIATHGAFFEDPDESFLLAYDGHLKMSQLGAEVSRFRQRRAPLALLVLSACETATGSDRAALGLAGMAVRAGARSVLGTLWLVNDAATRKLLIEFYREVQTEGVSRSIALQRAQLTLIGSSKNHHPAYWSPFVLIGSWL